MTPQQPPRLPEPWGFFGQLPPTQRHNTCTCGHDLAHHAEGQNRPCERCACGLYQRRAVERSTA